jgi:hypothetical protein
VQYLVLFSLLRSLSHPYSYGNLMNQALVAFFTW